jgi:hypothetical protein
MSISWENMKFYGAIISSQIISFNLRWLSYWANKKSYKLIEIVVGRATYICCFSGLSESYKIFYELNQFYDQLSDYQVY